MAVLTDFATEEIDYALTWLGCKEDIKTPNRSTCVNQIVELFGDSPSDEPWCAKYVWMVVNYSANKFGVKNLLPHTASTVTMKNDASKNGLIVDDNPAPGSVFFIPRGAGIGHVGLIIQVNNDGTINTIEGNYNNSVSYGHRDPATDSSFRFIHTENMAGGKKLIAGIQENQALIYGGLGVALLSLFWIHHRNKA